MKQKLGIAYSITGNYVKKTLPSLLSVLENNQKCSEAEKVDVSVFFYILHIEEEPIVILRELCEKYGVPLQIVDAQEYTNELEQAGDKTYNDSFVVDLFLIVPSVLDVDYNILFLQSDVVMNHGHSLIELAEYDFEGGKKSCASTIDLQSSPMIKEVVPLFEDQHVYNPGVFLVSPVLYKKHNGFKQYIDSMKERGRKLYPYYGVLRDAYALRNEVCELPIKYQIYPGQKMLKISQWKKIFGLKKADYYSDQEINAAIEDPVFVHYINFIVKKPWIRDLPKAYRSVGYWPYQDIWNYYADMIGNRDELLDNWNMTRMEKIKRYFFEHLRWIYVLLCTYYYRKEVRQRNSVIRKITAKDDAHENL